MLGELKTIEVGDKVRTQDGATHVVSLVQHISNGSCRISFDCGCVPIHELAWVQVEKVSN